MVKSRVYNILSQIKKSANWLAKSNIFLYSIVLSIVYFTIKGLISLFREILKIPDIEFRERLVNENFEVTVYLLVDALILVPIIETLVFQTLVFSILRRFKIKKWVIALIAGIAFGAFHNYSLFYMIGTAPIGFIFMYMYILRAEIDNKPLISTIIAHASINLVVTIAVLVTHFYKFGTWF
ncbi:MAG: CPBP family intramembrane metalloprotease [Bacteroidales bacterium]|nr:CPBP family intramembrane metalloprotease [Bacteroidales bacterium]